MKKKTEEVHQLNKGAHFVYTVHYHIIQCVKYRRRVLCFDEIVNLLKKKTDILCTTYGMTLKAFGSDKNHVHLLVECPSNFNVSRFMCNWKSSTSRYLRNRYYFLKRAINHHLWSPSYCIISTGNVALPVVESYVNNQGKTL